MILTEGAECCHAMRCVFLSIGVDWRREGGVGPWRRLQTRDGGQSGPLDGGQTCVGERARAGCGLVGWLRMTIGWLWCDGGLVVLGVHGVLESVALAGSEALVVNELLLLVGLVLAVGLATTIMRRLRRRAVVDSLSRSMLLEESGLRVWPAWREAVESAALGGLRPTSVRLCGVKVSESGGDVRCGALAGEEEGVRSLPVREGWMPGCCCCCSYCCHGGRLGGLGEVVVGVVMTVRRRRSRKSVASGGGRCANGQRGDAARGGQGVGREGRLAAALALNGEAEAGQEALGAAKLVDGDEEGPVEGFEEALFDGEQLGVGETGDVGPGLGGVGGVCVTKP